MHTLIQRYSGPIALSILVFGLGYFVGRIVDVQTEQSDSLLTVESRKSNLVPTVHLEGIRNKMLYGSLSGDVRLFIGDSQVLQTYTEGVFEVAAGPLLVHQIVIDIPDGMQFVASRRGTKYYSVRSKNAETIAPENRVYFQNSQDAVQAGYKE